MNIQHIHGVAPLYTNTFLIITNAKHGILIDAAAEPGVYLKALDEAGAPPPPGSWAPAALPCGGTW